MFDQADSVGHPNFSITRLNAGWLLRQKKTFGAPSQVPSELACYAVQVRARRHGRPFCDEKSMPTLPTTFDPLAVTVDWFDACRSGDPDRAMAAANEPSDGDTGH